MLPHFHQEQQELCVAMEDQPANTPDGAADQRLTAEVIDTHFQGRMLDLYQVVFEVWRANNLSPFEVLAGFGEGTTETAT